VSGTWLSDNSGAVGTVYQFAQATDTLADRLGAPVTVAIGGLASVAGSVWFRFQLPKIRVEARRLIVAQAIAGGEPSEMTAQAIED
jgi:hypothetical protein